MKYAQLLIIAILALVFIPSEAIAADEISFLSSQDDSWGDDDSSQDDSWGDDDGWGDEKNKEKKEDEWSDDDSWGDDDGWGDDATKPSKPYRQKKYMHFGLRGLGGGGDLRLGLAYGYGPNDGTHDHRVGFDLAVGAYTQVWGMRVANYFHFETTFNLEPEREDQYRFGFRNDALWHVQKGGVDLGLGGSLSIFQIAATSHDNEASWNPEIALVADFWHLWVRVPVQFYVGSELGVGFGPILGGSFQ